MKVRYVAHSVPYMSGPGKAHSRVEAREDRTAKPHTYTEPAMPNCLVLTQFDNTMAGHSVLDRCTRRALP